MDVIEFHLGMPQIIYLSLFAVCLLRTISQHGKQRTGMENGVASAVTGALVLGLLYWGGFFTSH
jgi:hypothetical protein